MEYTYYINTQIQQKEACIAEYLSMKKAMLTNNSKVNDLIQIRGKKTANKMQLEAKFKLVKLSEYHGFRNL